MSNRNALQGANVRTSCVSLRTPATNKQSQHTQKSPPWACDKVCAEACAERFSALNFDSLSLLFRSCEPFSMLVARSSESSILLDKPVQSNQSSNKLLLRVSIYLFYLCFILLSAVLCNELFIIANVWCILFSSQMTNRRTQCLVEATKRGFTLNIDPSEERNRCFYQCLSVFSWSCLKVAYHVIKRKDLETC